MRCLPLLSVCLLAVVPAAAAPKPNAAAVKAAPKAGPDVPSRVGLQGRVAVVNGESIPMTTYVDRLSLRFGPEVREMLIQETLLRQEVKRRGITASAGEIQGKVAAAYADTVRRSGGEAKLTEDLKNTRGWTPEDFKILIREQAEMQVLKEKLAAQVVKASDVTDKDVEDRYNAQKQQFMQPDTVRISHILIRRSADGNADKDAAARAKAEELLKRIQEAKGANFAQVAKEASEDKGSAELGGKIPSGIARGAHPFGAAFDAVVFNAPVGIVDQVIASPLGYHVIRVDSKEAGRTLPLSEVQSQIRTALLAERREQKLDELFVQLRSKAKIDTGKF